MGAASLIFQIHSFLNDIFKEQVARHSASELLINSDTASEFWTGKEPKCENVEGGWVATKERDPIRLYQMHHGIKDVVQ